MIVEAVAENAGHLGSNLGAVELSLALHRVFESPTDAILWDTGHQAYVHKIVTGRREPVRAAAPGGRHVGLPEPRGEPARLRREQPRLDDPQLRLRHGRRPRRRRRPPPPHRRRDRRRGDDGRHGVRGAQQPRPQQAPRDHRAQRQRPQLRADGVEPVGQLAGPRRAGRPSRAFPTASPASCRARSPTSASTRCTCAASAGSRTSCSTFPASARTPSGRWRRSRPACASSSSRRRSSRRSACATSARSTATTSPSSRRRCATPRSSRPRDRSCVHVLTQKGRGYPPAEDDDEKHLHDAPVFDPKHGPPKAVPTGYTQAFAEAIIKAAELDPRVVAITAAMAGPTGLDPVPAALPRPLLRRRHRRAARRHRRRRHGDGRAAAGGGDLLDVPQPGVGPGRVRRRPAPAAGDLRPRPGRHHRPRRAVAPRRVRHGAALEGAGHARAGAVERAGAAADDARRAHARRRRPGRDPLPTRRGAAGRRARRRVGPGGAPRHRRRRRACACSPIGKMVEAAGKAAERLRRARHRRRGVGRALLRTARRAR